MKGENNMLGLIKKDFLYIQQKFWILFFCFYFLLALISQKSFFLYFILSFSAFGLSIQAFQYDKYTGWDVYQTAFPVTAREIVMSRYLYSILIEGFCLLLDGIMMAVILFFRGNDILEGKPIIIIFLPILLGYLLIEAVVFPIIYYFGVDKARMILMLIGFGIPILVLGGYQSDLFGSFSSFSLSDTAFVQLCYYAVVPCLLLYVLSFFLSVKILKHNLTKA